MTSRMLLLVDVQSCREIHPVITVLAVSLLAISSSSAIGADIAVLTPSSSGTISAEHAEGVLSQATLGLSDLDQIADKIADDV